MKAAPGELHWFLTRVKFLGYIIEGSSIFPLKSQINNILQFQPPFNKD